MTKILPIIIYITLHLTSCEEKHKNNSGFKYDPTIPYPTLNPGDFWPDKFDQRGLQNAIIYQDKIYCNTIDVGSESNFLYGLNPNDGLVLWKAHVGAYASQPVSYCKGTIIYCSYLGHMYAFDTKGTKLWENKFDSPYGGHLTDTTNSTLFVKTVYSPKVSIYDVSSGKILTKIDSDSLKNLIKKLPNNAIPMQKEYRFARMGWNYVIKSKAGEMGTCKIEIKKYH